MATEQEVIASIEVVAARARVHLGEKARALAEIGLDFGEIMEQMTGDEREGIESAFKAGVQCAVFVLAQSGALNPHTMVEVIGTC